MSQVADEQTNGTCGNAGRRTGEATGVPDVPGGDTREGASSREAGTQGSPHDLERDQTTVRAGKREYLREHLKNKDNNETRNSNFQK